MQPTTFPPIYGSGFHKATDAAYAQTVRCAALALRLNAAFKCGRIAWIWPASRDFVARPSPPYAGANTRIPAVAAARASSSS